MATYKIHESLMEGLEKKVATIRRKCAKYGCDFTFKRVGEEFVKFKDYGVQRYVIVEAEGTAQMNGWQFVASIEHTPKGNIIRKALTDIEVPIRYWTSDTYCEHCNTNRMRKGTLLVRNEETGEFKQVGHSCIKDYTHGMDASWAAYMASLTDIFEQEEQTGFGGGLAFKGEYISVVEILQYTAELVKLYGYKKRYDDGDYIPNNTATMVEEYYNYNHGGFFITEAQRKAIAEEIERTGFNPESEYAVETARNALDWLAQQDESSDYMHNLKVIAAADYINSAKFGMLCSLIPCYNRALEREKAQQEKNQQAEKEAKVADYIGKVGDRITIAVADCICVASWGTDFGVTCLYKIVDDAGNVYMWKTANFVDTERVKTVVGTIKEHSEYKGVKQNIITRCRVA